MRHYDNQQIRRTHTGPAIMPSGKPVTFNGVSDCALGYPALPVLRIDGQFSTIAALVENLLA